MTPPTLNAYYHPLMNNINFPAGILQPPFFDRANDDAVNYGAIGAVIGHELTHGFDDQGRHFDAEGNLRDWWSEADAKEFESRASCIADEYSKFDAVPDMKLNGKLTLGENTADNGGVRIARMALMQAVGANPPPPADGFSLDQRFFVAYAQVWCQSQRPEVARMLATVDVHSPGRARQRRRVQHAGIPEGVLVQGGIADGESEHVPRLVGADIKAPVHFSSSAFSDASARSQPLPITS